MRSYESVTGQAVSSSASQHPKQNQTVSSSVAAPPQEPEEPEEQKEENPRGLRRSKRRRKNANR